MKKYRGPKPLVPATRQVGMHITWAWHQQAYGKDRREAIVRWLEEDSDRYIPINKKYCPVLRKDPDLKRMLKGGVLKMHKIPWGGRCTLSVLRLMQQ